MTLEEAKAQLQEGGEYEITHQDDSQRYRRKSRMSFLGVHRGTNELLFNARPAFGTQTFRAEDIKDIRYLGASIGRDDPRRYVNKRA
jgi:hypothetical protein